MTNIIAEQERFARVFKKETGLDLTLVMMQVIAIIARSVSHNNGIIDMANVTSLQRATLLSLEQNCFIHLRKMEEHRYQVYIDDTFYELLVENLKD